MSGRLFEAFRPNAGRSGSGNPRLAGGTPDKRRRLAAQDGRTLRTDGRQQTGRRAVDLRESRRTRTTGAKGKEPAFVPYVDLTSSTEEEEDSEDEYDPGEDEEPRQSSSRRGRIPRNGRSRTTRNGAPGGKTLRSTSRSARILSPLPPNVSFASANAQFAPSFDMMAQNGKRHTKTADGRKIIQPSGSRTRLAAAAGDVMRPQLTRTRSGFKEFGRGIRGAFQKAFSNRDGTESRGTKRKRDVPPVAPTLPNSKIEVDGEEAEAEQFETTEDEVEEAADEDAETADSEAEAPSISEMSVDGDGEAPAVELEDIEHDGSGDEDDPNDDSFYLFTASQPQLHRLRRDRLVELAKLILDGEDDGAEAEVEASTKEALVKQVIEAVCRTISLAPYSCLLTGSFSALLTRTNRRATVLVGNCVLSHHLLTLNRPASPLLRTAVRHSDPTPTRTLNKHGQLLVGASAERMPSCSTGI